MLKQITVSEAGELKNWGGDTEKFEWVDEWFGENERWTCPATTYFKEVSTGNYYAFDWDKGLTKMQEDLIGGFDCFDGKEDHMVDVYQVKQIEKTITTWERV